MAQRVAYSALKPLVDRGEITPDQIAAKVAAGEIEVLDDRAAPATPAPSLAPQPTGERSLGGFAENVVSSGAKVVKDIATAVSQPVQTLKAVGGVISGAAQSGTAALGVPPPQERGLRDDRPKFDAVADFYRQRYGGWDNIKKTAYEDPVGFLLDASTVLSGGAAGASRAGLTRTGEVLATAAKVTDPIAMTGRTVGTVANKVGAPLLGKTTGVGAEAVREAAKATPEFAEGLRGAATHEDVVEGVRGAIKTLADDRRTTYQGQLAQLPKTQVTTRPVIAALRQKLADFGVTLTPVKDKAGNVTAWTAKFDGPMSKITDHHEMDAIQAVVDDVWKNGGSTGSLDALALDALKQRTGDRMGVGSRSDAILAATKDAAKQALEQGVPGYADMTKDYAEASALLDQITAELSSKGGAGKTGTAVRKLTNLFNKRDTYRQALVETLDRELGTNIKGMLAGAEMSSVTPRGLMAPLTGAGALMNPKMLALLPLTSPRFVGEALLALANVRKGARAVSVKNPAVGVAGAVNLARTAEAANQ